MIYPFKAVTPHPGLVQNVVSHPYDSYSEETLGDILQQNEHSFLQVITSAKTGGEKLQYANVKKTYQRFLAQGVLKSSDESAVYLHQMRHLGQCFTGIVALSDVKDYENRKIKPHEDTLSQREKLFASYLKKVGFHAEPVLLAYEQPRSVEELVSEIRQQKPIFDFEIEDGSEHTVWKVSGNVLAALQQAFGEVPSAYIADGHHRTASSARMARELEVSPDAGYFLTYWIPDTDLRIDAFHIGISDLRMDTDTFIRNVSDIFDCRPVEAMPKLRTTGHFGMYLEGRWYDLQIKPEAYPLTGPLQRLNMQILTTTICKSILGIHNLRRNDRIHYAAGDRGIKKLVADVDQGKSKVCFNMLPASFDLVKEIADRKEFMPPKSTYIEPKMISGLFLYAW